ncbi:hypothetical protein TNCV_2459191 [Trichonephila clavipes]|nr:hypothetical protein TNCV_2459191 [Trichonephila clavipes]
MKPTYFCRRPSGIVISDTDCGAVGSGFESQERHGCLCSNSLHCDVCFTLASIIVICGYGHELVVRVSRTRVLVPLKTHRVEEYNVR